MDAPIEAETVELVRRAQDGDAQAEELLFERFAPYVYRIIALRYGRPVDALGDVDDLVQDVLLKVHVTLDQFGRHSGANDFRAWLAAVARSVVFDDRRRWLTEKRGGGRARAIGHGAGPGETAIHSSILADNGPTPSSVVSAREIDEKVMEALLGLEEQHRKIIVYRKLCGLGYDEVAEKLGIGSGGASRVLLHRALRKLEEALTKRGIASRVFEK